MDEILSASRRLGRLISKSEIYLDYSAALERIKEAPELLAEIAEFKRIHIEYSRDGISFDQEKHLSKLFFDLNANPKAAQFLEAEKKMLALVLGIYENLWAECEFQVTSF